MQIDEIFDSINKTDEALKATIDKKERLYEELASIINTYLSKLDRYNSRIWAELSLFPETETEFDIRIMVQLPVNKPKDLRLADRIKEETEQEISEFIDTALPNELRETILDIKVKWEPRKITPADYMKMVADFGESQFDTRDPQKIGENLKSLYKF